MSATGQYPDYQCGFIRDRLTIAVLGGIWHDVRMEYDVSDLLIYKGTHEKHDMPDTDTDWEIWKYTYDGTNVTRIEGPLRGAWHDRATLSWGT